ncbi:MAG: YraN family protein [Acidobacteria bacterium]|nr:YraN family protein [Acidobacteriota bacterium]
MTSWLWRRAAPFLDALRHRVRLRRWPAGHAWGRRGEDLAHRYLEEHGLTVVARNYRARSSGGEVDLIAWEGPTLVFVEVKTRATDAFGPPEEAVDREKRRHLVRAAGEYVRRRNVPWESVRFDVVSVVYDERTSIQHRRAAFGRHS